MPYQDVLASTDLYQPLRPYLSELRLLTVFPGNCDDPVECVLRRTSLDREYHQRYETISYCWGEAEHYPWGDIRPRGSVLVNGTQLNVPASSEAALRRMRLPDKDRVLWIDSICINQSDLRERGHQVSMIGSIYRMAAGNLIHLGDSDFPIDADGLKQVASQVRDIVFRRSVRPTPKPEPAEPVPVPVPVLQPEPVPVPVSVHVLEPEPEPEPEPYVPSKELEPRSIFKKVRSTISRVVKPRKESHSRRPTPSPVSSQLESLRATPSPEPSQLESLRPTPSPEQSQLESLRPTPSPEPSQPKGLRAQLQQLETLYETSIKPKYEIIFGSEWFTRLWVVQEASLAVRNTCYWGPAIFSLDDALALGIAAYRYATPKTRIYQNAYSTRYIRRFIETNFESPITGSLRKRPKGVQLFRYVKLSQHLTCIDSHDRVYAVLDMYKLQYGLPKLPSFLVPDYTKPIADLYRDMTRLALSGPGATEILDMVLHRSNSTIHEQDLPSWAIRWGNKAVSGFPPSERDHYAGQSYQDTRCFLKMAPYTDPKILSLKGYVVGRVSRRHILFSHRQMVRLKWVRDMIDGIFALLYDGLSAHVYADTDHNALLSTLLTRGRIKKDTAAPQSKLMSLAFETAQDQLEAFVLFRSYLDTHRELPAVSRTAAAAAGISESVVKFLGAFNGESNDRCIFQLETGHIGSGPPILQEDDILVVFCGTENAHIIRPIGNDLHQFIGFAYVEGLMHGQVLKMGLKKQLIHLK